MSGAPRHRAVAGAPTGRVAVSDGAGLPAESGTVAVLPDPDPLIVGAVESAGGRIDPLGPETRGLVWNESADGRGLERVLAEHPAVRWVQLPWAGVDGYLETFARLDGDGRVWTSAKGAYAQPVAEHALTLALALLRGIPARLAARTWAPDEVGTSLYGARVTIVGAGGIAMALLALLAPFGADVTVVRRSAASVPGARRTLPASALREALSGAEVVFLAAALTEESRGLIGRDELDVLAPGAVLVNVARGGLVDTDELVAALRTGRLGGAGLDVTYPEPLPDGHPLWDAPNTIVTPHVADTDAMSDPLFAERVAVNTAAFLGRGEYVGRIDLGAGY